MSRAKVKLAFTANQKSRKTTFMRRRKGMLKKLNEITTLCDIQACAVVYSPDAPVPEMWPSPQGVQEVISKFLEVPENDRNKKMMDHKTYLEKKIAKEKAKLNKLAEGNQKTELNRKMFDYLQGRHTTPDQHRLEDLHILYSYTQYYLDQLLERAEFLRIYGESSSSSAIPGQSASSSLPQLPAAVANVNPSVAADTAAITAPVGFFYFNPYQNQHGMVPHNALAAVTGDNPLAVTDAAPVTHESGQHYVPAASYELQTQDLMNMNQNQQELIQYQVPMNLVDPMDGLNLNLDLGHNPNLHSHQQQIFMNPMMGYPQQMGYVGEHASVPFMDGNNYNYHQLPTVDPALSLLPTVDPATTGHMPTITTSATSAFSPCINNDV